MSNKLKKDKGKKDPAKKVDWNKERDRYEQRRKTGLCMVVAIFVISMLFLASMLFGLPFSPLLSILVAVSAAVMVYFYY